MSSIKNTLNNTPNSISSNETSSSVVTLDGELFMAGLFRGEQTNGWKQILDNDSTIGTIVKKVDIENNKQYLLNRTGSVYEFTGDPTAMREVYSPIICNSDPAVDLVAGMGHIIIRTKNGKVYGIGRNDRFQIVPNGQCYYSTATEIVVSTYLDFDDSPCNKTFSGTIKEYSCESFPVKNNNTKTHHLKETRCDQDLGYIRYNTATVKPACKEGSISIPVRGDITYFGTLYIDGNGCATGNINYSISKLYVPCGPIQGLFSWTDCEGCHTVNMNLNSSCAMELFSINVCNVGPNSDPCNNGKQPIVGTAYVNGKCNSCITVNIDLSCCQPTVVLPTGVYDAAAKAIIFTNNNPIPNMCSRTSTVTTNCTGEILDFTQKCASVGLDFDIYVQCEREVVDYSVPTIKQPCWVSVQAGFDSTTLVDNCGSVWYLGSMGAEVKADVTHTKESNPDCGGCNLPPKAKISFSLPLDAVCGNGQLDMSKGGAHISLDDYDGNICDAIAKFKNCGSQNQQQNYNEQYNVNEDNRSNHNPYIYLHVGSNDSSTDVGSVTIFNSKSVDYGVTVSRGDVVRIKVNYDSDIMFDINGYCIDGHNVPLTKILKLEFCDTGSNIPLFVDTDVHGGIKFVSNTCGVAEVVEYNVEYNISASDCKNQFILKYGELPMDALMRSNLKQLLGLEPFFPNAMYRNPLNTKLIFTYLTGGDVVKIVSKNPNNLRHEVTPDLPTKFNIKGKRVDNVTLGFNNIVVSTSGLDGNSVYAIGNNQFGELGVGSKKTKIHWTQVCKTWIGRIKSMYSSIMATFFLCTDGNLLSSGRWNGHLDSVEPRRVEGVNPQWKIKDVSVNDKNIIMIGNAGELAGMGTNSVGELGIRDRDIYPVRLLQFNPSVQNQSNGMNSNGQNNQYYPQPQQPQPQSHHQPQQKPNFTIPPMPQIPSIQSQHHQPQSYSYNRPNSYHSGNSNNYSHSYNNGQPRFVYTNSNPLFYQ